MSAGTSEIYRALAVVALALAGLLLSAIAAEAVEPMARWWQARRAWSGRGQSRLVRRCSAQLASAKRRERIAAAELLGELGDRTAVPALAHAAERYHGDGAFVESAIWALQRLGDPRAVRTLERLATCGQERAESAAAHALISLQPRGELLRGADAADSAGAGSLLRTAIPGGHENDSRSLPRVANAPPDSGSVTYYR